MSKYRPTPQDALERAISWLWLSNKFSPNRSHKGKPGEVIQSLPESQRTLLRQLTSDHHLNHRFDGL